VHFIWLPGSTRFALVTFSVRVGRGTTFVTPIAVDGIAPARMGVLQILRRHRKDLVKEDGGNGERWEDQIDTRRL